MDTLKMQYKLTGDGMPLVLLPGGLTGSSSWDSFVPDLSVNNQVIQLQLISVQCGLENRDLPQNYSVRLESDAIAESLKDIGITNPTDFIGWSYGSFVLLDFALNHPQLVRSLTLIEPPAFWILKEHKRETQETSNIIKFMKTLNGDISEKQLEMFMITVGFAEPGVSLQEHPQWSNWLKHRKSLRNSGQVTMHTDKLERLLKFEAPVLLVKGSGSASFLHEIIELLGQDLPHTETVEFAGGHAPHIVAKDEFLRKVREFQSKY